MTDARPAFAHMVRTVQTVPRVVPPPPPPPPSPGFAAAPILALACIALTIFIIAATIVLALIPIYLDAKDVDTNSGQPFYCTADYDGSLGNDGDLDATARAQVARSLENAARKPANSIMLDQGRVATTPTGRRRRGFGVIRFGRGTTPNGFQRLYLVLRVPGNLNPSSGQFSPTFVFNNMQVNPTLRYSCSRTPIAIPPVFTPTPASPVTARLSG